jgi:nitrate/nitrite-specific signal transduction histidine kinase
MVPVAPLVAPVRAELIALDAIVPVAGALLGPVAVVAVVFLTRVAVIAPLQTLAEALL